MSTAVDLYNRRPGEECRRDTRAIADIRELFDFQKQTGACTFRLQLIQTVRVGNKPLRITMMAHMWGNPICEDC
eukprot:COSAG02_NODE_26949_length_620_cov_1.186180_1_plen_73_part_01